MKTGLRKTYRLSLFLLCGLLISCSPAFWQGVSQGLDSYYDNSYTGNVDPTSDQEILCVKYKTTTGWSHGYQVNAYVLKGSELNRRTRTFNYNHYSTYVVVFWAKGEASILELDSYFGSISYWGHFAKDQYGREWQVSKTIYCY